MARGKTTNKGRITFGFKNINGRAFQMKILNAPEGRFVDRLTLAIMRQRVVSTMNKHGREAERIARKPGHSPFLTGAMVASIRWQSAKRTGFTGFVVGSLSVGVPYGRWQEFNNRRRPLFLYRAVQQAFQSFTDELRNMGILSDAIMRPKRHQVGGPTVRGGFF